MAGDRGGSSVGGVRGGWSGVGGSGEGLVPPVKPGMRMSQAAGSAVEVGVSR